MVLGFPLFRTRSPERDRETDAARLRRMQYVLDQTVSEMGRELAGLQRRIDDSMNRAVAVMDDSGDYTERDPKDEKLITDYESQVSAGQKRIAHLNRQLAVYQSIGEALSGLRPQEDHDA